MCFSMITFVMIFIGLPTIGVIWIIYAIKVKPESLFESISKTGKKSEQKPIKTGKIRKEV